jgi:hypothetical protein
MESEEADSWCVGNRFGCSRGAIQNLHSVEILLRSCARTKRRNADAVLPSDRELARQQK